MVSRMRAVRLMELVIILRGYVDQSKGMVTKNIMVVISQSDQFNHSVFAVYFYSPIQLRLYSITTSRDVLYVCADYLYTTFVCFLALLSLLHFSILSNCFFILVQVYL